VVGPVECIEGVFRSSGNEGIKGERKEIGSLDSARQREGLGSGAGGLGH
jgi:hypothetical protein